MRDSTNIRRSSFQMPEQEANRPRRIMGQNNHSNLTFTEAMEEVRAAVEADENDDYDETSE
eukprot:CAMPEP_0178935082 /NCGR_PEP_ID=MMETSP0786-20121207/24296_1 /TAXON_ID=186022 /ORGANISM="Thalassionema frauenfeldii, Strain CCMP 1798" /LENGTH=60 /DNA_ID=CAMNT_0020613087 /DNA_START=333 /DNA_END=515 /DNA_ORIENTATION=+